MKPYRVIGADEYSNVGMSGYGGGIQRPPRAVREVAGWTEYDERMLQQRKERMKAGASTTTFGKDIDNDFIILDETCPQCGGMIVVSGMDEVCSECGQIFLDIDDDYDQMSDKDFEQQHGDIVEDRKGISGILVEDDDDIGFFDEQGKWSKMLQVVGDKFKEFVSVDEMISPKDEPKKGSSNIPMPDDIAGVSDETEEYNFKDFFDNY